MSGKNSKHSKKLISIIAALFLLSAPNIMAAPADHTDVGSREGITQERSIASSASPVPQIQVGQDVRGGLLHAGEPTIKVERLRITGQDIYSEDKLLSLVNISGGKDLTLDELEALAGQITRYFREQGYLVASAYIPAQDVKDGTVEIAVVVGRYGQIDIRNLSRLSDARVQSLLKGLEKGEYIEKEALERALLMINETSGVSVKATLTPGQEPGSADLILDIADTKRFHSSLSADNYGNRFTGKTQGSIAITIHNPSGAGDEAALGGTYGGVGLSNLNLSYEHPVGTLGDKLGLTYSHTRYRLGEEYASLDANGESKASGINYTHSFIRTRSRNLNGYLGFARTELEDRIDVAASVTDKHAEVWDFGINGSKYDPNGNGNTSFALGYHSGRLFINNAVAAAVDEATSKTAGKYNKATLGLLRHKQLNPCLSYSLAFSGQLADKNLDSSEKLFLGGAGGIRAYPQGEAAGDEGYLITGELRWNLPTPRFQLTAFIDTGYVILNKKPWDTSMDSRSLTGAGMGLVWNSPGGYSISLNHAWKIGSASATSDIDGNGRFLFQCIKHF